MKRIILVVISLFFVLEIPAVSSAGDVNISIGIPAPFAFSGPPELVVVPSGEAYIYMVPGTVGLYFYNNWWYRFDRGHWYRSHTYNGRWGYVESRRVPRYVADVPPDYYRHLPREYHRIPYGDFNRRWRSWDRDRHWNRYDWYQREHREYRDRTREHKGSHDYYDGGRHDSGRHDGYKDRGDNRGNDNSGSHGSHGDKTHPDDRDMGGRR